MRLMGISRFTGGFLPLDDHGQGISLVIKRFKRAGDIVIKFLQSGHNDPAAAHAGDDFRDRMGIVSKGL